MITRRISQVAAMLIPLCMVTASTHNPLAVTLAESASVPSSGSLQQVPPNGLESLDESGLRYFQQMGPLEYAARLGGTPNPDPWRVRLRLYPDWQDNDLIYQVKMDHYNLSSELYDSLVSSYGIENVEPSLNDPTPHQHISLEFLPIMNVSADWLPDSTYISQSDLDVAPVCGLDQPCTSLVTVDQDSHWTNETVIGMDIAPWDSQAQPLPTMVRALAKQAGWQQDGRWMMPDEIPEGISHERPWVEVLVTNYPGNGGGYLAHWIERHADDSIRAVVHQIYHDPMETTGYGSQGYLCGRGITAGTIQSICP